ncbi:Hpt domain-containing protein [Methylobacterium sp. M6A4_1b]
MLLDAEHLARQTFGDVELAAELMGLFAAQCLRLLPGIVDAGGPIAERADLAHTLKGSALGVGAVRIALSSGAVEDALRTGAAASCDELAAAVRETLAALPQEP